MPDGVLDDGLQDEGGHRHRAARISDVELDTQPLAEPCLLNADVTPDDVDFHLERHHLIARSVERVAHQLTQSDQHLQRAVGIGNPLECTIQRGAVEETAQRRADEGLALYDQDANGH